MPTYVYRFVDTGETIEVQQAFSDAALTEARHPGTGELMAVKKVFTPVGVTFKGSGFYKTDSRGSSSRTAASTSSSTSSSDGGSSSASAGDGGSKESKPATESKPAKESKAASASSSSD